MKISANSPMNIDESGLMLNSKIGQRLKTERERLELNQAQFGQIVNVSKRTVSDWERGLTSPNIHQALLLSMKGLDIVKLFSDSPIQTTLGTSFGEIVFDEDSSMNLRKGLAQIDVIFEENPSWNLLNVESIRNQEGVTTGLRYFFQSPSVQHVQDQSLDNAPHGTPVSQQPS